MGFRLPGIVHAKKNKVPSKSLDVPKGYFAVYVGEGEKKRFVIPVSYLNQPSFQDLLTRAEDEFGYDHPMGAITIPCSENTFLDLTSSFDKFWVEIRCQRMLQETLKLVEFKEGLGLRIK
ncbi:auxin-induced protein 15A [Prunus yedoensis var. nudiflora]|uniref:Auxin-induced protein 15A n=1 Tax=Prunus yedoensis var. nudiflora TaxID=2094558 RepID=A0A314YPQ7_PRUYE|nr:auxin-induced protein 15A [Prunus yedoensis var. nudiflora]